jgi:hypothetical protein
MQLGSLASLEVQLQAELHDPRIARAERILSKFVLPKVNEAQQIGSGS